MNIKIRAANSDSFFQATNRLAIAFLLIAIAGLTFIPIDTALAKHTHTHDDTQRYYGSDELLDFGSPSLKTPDATSVEIPEPVYPDFIFEDENSGAILDHYPSNSLSEENELREFVAPEIEAIIVQRGEECLHAEGTCEACDELRKMFREGDVDALYRVTIVPEISTEDIFTLSVPLDTWVSRYASFHCENGSLDSRYMIITAAVAERGFTSASNRGSISALQSPFGIAYNKSEPQTSTTIDAHAYTPDDDDDEDWLKKLIEFVLAIGFLAAIGGVIYLVSWLWHKLQIKW